MPIYADNSLTDNNVLSYMLQLNYDQSYFKPESVIVTGTISASFGDPTINTSIPGKDNYCGAGTTPLPASGKFIIIRFKAKQPYGAWINFTDAQSNYFNEGTPALSLKMDI